MNRLWIRFSVIISSLSLVIILLWVVIERLDPVVSRDGFSFDSDLRLYALTGELAETMILVGTIAVILGVWLSRGLSAPIVALSKAAKQIGSGDLQQRVPVQNHSQELDDLARSFNRMAADLENADTLRKNMLADISHELEILSNVVDRRSISGVFLNL
jgi:methyl-accepting chemotaxis protein